MSDSVVITKTVVINEQTSCGTCNKKRCLWKDWPWFSPQAQMMCRSRLMWYIENKSKYFDLGLWPDNPYLPKDYVTPKDNPEIKGGVKVPTNAFLEFVTTIENRLKKCGRAGKTLVEEIQMWGAHYDKLSTDAKDALNYCCGNERAQSFAKWKADRKDKDKKKLKKAVNVPLTS